ncbi:ABC transporter permease subunit [[Mycoplasma] falconis]|uniref:ABC transporter permease subunit n=1 Tax=[Mycoplasma] falconis TaxID=92403 RepID=A0A501X922_9BACT|nr:ABC transporter permease subunit [[Mycoplasma] falconis]TPE56929.1 ABC transporter permease subunit [[Mycoplasma] falconis]
MFNFAKQRLQNLGYAVHKNNTKIYWQRYFTKKSNIAIFSIFLAILLIGLICLLVIKNSPINSIDNNSIYVNDLPPIFNQVITRNFERGAQLDFIRNIADQETKRASELGINLSFYIIFDSARDVGGSLTVNTDIVTLIYNPYHLIEAINNLNPDNQIIINHLPLLGTNANGVDIYARIWSSVFLTLTILLIAIFINMFMGFSFAALYSFNSNKWYAIVIDKIATMFISIPEIIWIFLLCIFAGTNWYGVLISFILIGWFYFYEASKQEIKNVKSFEFIIAAKAIGLSQTQIIYRHVFKRILPSLLILLVDRLTINILIVSSLAFLDFITNANNLNIGTILKEAIYATKSNPWYLAIISTYLTGFSIMLKLFSLSLATTLNPWIN